MKSNTESVLSPSSCKGSFRSMTVYRASTNVVYVKRTRSGTRISHSGQVRHKRQAGGIAGAICPSDLDRRRSGRRLGQRQNLHWPQAAMWKPFDRESLFTLI